MRIRIAVLLLALVGCTLTACTAAAPAPQQPARPSAAVLASTTARVRPEWSSDIRPVGEPIVRNGVVASYVRVGQGGLEVRAWQLADGVELWRRTAEVGQAPEGVEVSLEAVRHDGQDFVTFLAPSPDARPYELVVAALATGTPLEVHDDAVRASSRPAQCDDDVCFEGWSVATARFEEPARPLRLDLGRGRIRFDTGGALPAGAFEIGDHLFAWTPTGSDAQVLGAADAGGAVHWRRRYAAVFGKGASTAGGWGWQRIGTTLVGTGGADGVLRGGVFRDDLGSTAVVELDAATGRTRWRIPHTGPCGQESIGDWTSGSLIVLCRVRGTISTPDVPHPVPTDSTYAGVRVTMIGVDTTTGRVTWSRPAAPDLVRSAGGPIASGRWLPVVDRRRTLLLDRVTGRTAALPAGAVVACAAARSSLRAPDPDEHDRAGDYAAGDGIAACGDEGASLSRFAVTRAGNGGGDGWWAVAGSDGLSVYHLG